jgi:hypothetical protein
MDDIRQPEGFISSRAAADRGVPCVPLLLGAIRRKESKLTCKPIGIIFFFFFFFQYAISLSKYEVRATTTIPPRLATESSSSALLKWGREVELDSTAAFLPHLSLFLSFRCSFFYSGFTSVLLSSANKVWLMAKSRTVR